MFRPRVTVHLLVPVFAAVAILASACGASFPEQPQVQQFFRASSLGDSQTLANFAAVSYDPKTEGQVMTFTIVSVSAPKVEPLRIKELAKAVEAAQAADREFSDRGKAYQDSHVDALKRVLAAESANKKVSGADAAVQAEWSKWREESAASLKKVSDARKQLSDARPVAEMSLSTPNGPAPDLSQADGQMESKDVIVDATVKLPDGSTTQKKLAVSMQRVVVKATPTDKAGKWIFVAVKPA
jgi:hypothetical protein